MKKVEIYRVDYTISTRRDENWTAYIAGFNSKTVMEYLEGYIQGGRVIITAMTTVSRLDAVTPGVRKLIAQPLLPIGKQKIEEKAEELGETVPQKRSIVPKG